MKYYGLKKLLAICLHPFLERDEAELVAKGGHVIDPLNFPFVEVRARHHCRPKPADLREQALAALGLSWVAQSLLDERTL